MSLISEIKSYLCTKANGLASVKDICAHFNHKPATTVRGRLNEQVKKENGDICRVPGVRGVYMLKSGNCHGVLIHGDGNDLSMIEDESISCIVCDHPWSNPKQNRGGNRNFTKGYSNNVFCYTQEHWNEKARIVKPGCFVAEVMPFVLETSVDYIHSVMDMARKAGFSIYCKIMWQKSRSNTGRTTKEFEDIYIFSKGEPRRLNNNKKLVYKTPQMLQQAIKIPSNRGKNYHPSEKPIALFEYLISQLSLENEVVLDNYSGSGNSLQAAINMNRFAIAFEIMEEYVKRAVEKLGLTPIWQEPALI